MVTKCLGAKALGFPVKRSEKFVLGGMTMNDLSGKCFSKTFFSGMFAIEIVSKGR